MEKANRPSKSTKPEWPFLRDVFTSWAPQAGYEFGADECPWIPNIPGIYNKFMVLDRHHNSFVNLFKIDPGTVLPPHYHTTPVFGYVIEGEFKYREYDWVARPGSTIYEPAGEVHTLVNEGTQPMTAVFHVTGPQVNTTADGRFLSYLDVGNLIHYVRDYCEIHGVDDSFLARIIR